MSEPIIVAAEALQESFKVQLDAATTPTMCDALLHTLESASAGFLELQAQVLTKKALLEMEPVHELEEGK